MPVINRLRFAAIFAALAAAMLAAAPARAATLPLDNSFFQGQLFSSDSWKSDWRKYTWEDSFQEHGYGSSSSVVDSNVFGMLRTDVSVSNFSGSVVCGKYFGVSFPSSSKFVVVAPSFLFGSGTSGRSVPISSSSVYFYSSDGSIDGGRRNGDGTFSPTRDAYGVILVSSVSGFSTSQYAWIDKPSISISLDSDSSSDVIGAINDASQQSHEDLQNLGDKLTDTSGSDSVAGDVVSGAMSGLDSSVTLMSQVSSVVGKFTSITADEDSSVRFPGIEFGEFVLPAMEVDIWQHFGPLQTPCKVICTGALIFLWLRGVQSLIGRIFHGEVDVIVDEE